MSHIELNHDEQPIRLFKSNFMEFFTHISPIAILVIWIPILAGCFWLGSLHPQNNWSVTLVGFLIGLFIWTFSEYILHRFLFHFKPHNDRQERVAFLFHGVHHAQPKVKTRLVMPPALSIPLAALFYGLFYLVFEIILSAGQWMYPAFAGFLTGYLIYDLMHYATHHFPMRKGIWKQLKRLHMQHHYKYPNQLFGVSSPIWDYVFSTLPREK
jgi:sterol desaturase/sphingolipid hydroxylase (fatty acid hydroxylase superfamily)